MRKTPSFLGREDHNKVSLFVHHSVNIVYLSIRIEANPFPPLAKYFQINLHEDHRLSFAFMGLVHVEAVSPVELWS